MSVAGGGFAPGAQVRVTFGAYLVTVLVAGSDGRISAVFTPPVFDSQGRHLVTASGPGGAGRTLALRAGVAYRPF